MEQKQHSLWLPAVILAAGLVLAAGFLGTQLKNLRQPGEITVKGLAEENHRADTAEWQVGVALQYPSYADAVAGLQRELPSVLDFLRQQGFDEQEIAVGSPNIGTHYDEVYENERYRQVANGFDAQQYVMVTTRDLDKLQKANNAILELRARSEYVRFEAPQYLLSNLEQIKHELIAKATADAHRRAQEFAKSGDAKVTAMRSASQGAFNILSNNISNEGDDNYGGQYDKSTVEKRVRLVVTIRYGVE
ncbi:MAG: SIMPL domain-containing protein [Neisseria sp.]|nr:SIMPL domain-containing protein [Neisseria sp.]